MCGSSPRGPPFGNIDSLLFGPRRETELRSCRRRGAVSVNINKETREKVARQVSALHFLGAQAPQLVSLVFSEVLKHWTPPERMSAPALGSFDKQSIY